MTIQEINAVLSNEQCIIKVGFGKECLTYHYTGTSIQYPGGTHYMFRLLGNEISYRVFTYDDLASDYIRFKYLPLAAERGILWDYKDWKAYCKEETV